jgi:cellulose synthase (UDP-forming)
MSGSRLAVLNGRGDSEVAVRQTTVPVMSAAERHSYRGLGLLWLGATVAFWAWWCQPSHVVSVPGFLVTSLVVAYTLAMPAYLLFFVGRMRRPNRALAPPDGLRVTFATTFVPGAESIHVLEQTITAMRDQEGYPHDVWVLDEGDQPEVRELCRRVGVRHFSRKGIARYQSPAWPFKARTKAGNYNSWLDWLDSRGTAYDVLLQMDTDHVPQPGYLVEMLRPIADPDVAYVAAPSITSANEADSWVVRARCEVEATLHGALQMGYNGGFAPLIIGSHAAFRVAALRAIGGFQHTLAEDHHNTLRFHSNGMRGVFNPDAIAVGDGASSLAAAMVQEYQWARALTQILLNFFPGDGRTLRPHLWAQFLFAETWYPLFGLNQALGWLIPIIALLSGRPWVLVSYVQFVVIHGLSTVTCLALVSWLRRRGWLRPAAAPVMSWRSALLMLARWPFVLMAAAEATLGWALRRDFQFRVTQKGAPGRKALPARILAPYVVIVLGSLAAVAVYLRRGASGPADGYVYLALVSAATYLGLIVAAVLLNQRENVRTWRVPRLAAWRMHASGHGIAVGLIALFGVIGTAALPRAAEAASWQSPGAVRAEFGAVAFGRGVAAPCDTLAPTALERAVRQAASRTGPPAGSAACAAVGLPLERQFLGVYDPSGAMAGPVDAEEVFVQWKPAVAAEIRTQVARILSVGRVPIVTVEPYPWGIDGLGGPTLLSDIAAGRYDAVTRQIAETVSAFAPAPVYLRFAHEMDLTGAFPWSQGDPPAYIAAYRHFVHTVRASTANAQFIWSPSGGGGSAGYYPGDDVVDQVGVTLLVADEWSGTGRTPSFVAMMDGRYRLAVQLGKPLIVCELGASIGDPAARLRWAQEARAAMDRYPRLLGVVYFDATNPPIHQMPGAAVADWRLTPAEQATFFAAPAKDAP